MISNIRNGVLTLLIEKERIDSNNALEFDRALKSNTEGITGIQEISLDMVNLKYISSAGLRGLLKLRKNLKKPIKAVHVSDDIYEILDTTGFTSFIEVEENLRSVIVDMDESNHIGRVLNGDIYRMDNDQMIKIYDKSVSLEEIKREREYAQKAVAYGIPTLISYDVVSCGKNYGIVYEEVGFNTLAHEIKDKPKMLEPYARYFASFLKELHETEIESDDLPNIKDRYQEWMEKAGDRLTNETKKMLMVLIRGISDKTTYLHGDINPSNVLVEDNEFLLIDMAGSSYGHPIFDLQGIYASLVAMEESYPNYCQYTFNLSPEDCKLFWDHFYSFYADDFDSTSTAKMNDLLKKYFVLKTQLLSVLGDDK